MSNGGIRNWILVCFHRFYSDLMIALKYDFIVFSKQNHHFLVYIHCIYIGKRPNWRYSFNNGTVIFYRKFNQFYRGFYIDKWSLWSGLSMVSFFLSIKFDPHQGPRVLINLSYKNILCWIRQIPDHLKMREMCNEEVRMEPYSSEVVPSHLNTQEMCNEPVRRESFTLYHVSEDFKTQGMCDETVRIKARSL